VKKRGRPRNINPILKKSEIDNINPILKKSEIDNNIDNNYPKIKDLLFEIEQLKQQIIEREKKSIHTSNHDNSYDFYPIEEFEIRTIVNGVTNQRNQYLRRIRRY